MLFLSQYIARVLDSISIVDSTNVDKLEDIVNSDFNISSFYGFNTTYSGNVLSFEGRGSNSKYLMPYYKEDNLILTKAEDKAKLLCYPFIMSNVPTRLNIIIEELKECRRLLNLVSQQFTSLYMSSQYGGLLFTSNLLINNGGVYSIDKTNFTIHGFTPSTNIQDVLIDQLTEYDGIFIISKVEENSQLNVYTYYCMGITSDLSVSNPLRFRLKIKLPQFMQIIKANNVKLRTILALHYNNYAVKCNELTQNINQILAFL